MNITLKSQVTEIIGRTESSSVLDEILFTLASGWRRIKRGVRLKKRARSEAEILCGARILQELTLLAIRTYEGRPITTGIIVAEEWAYDGSSRHWSWLVKLPADLRPTVSNRSELMKIAALADGKRSFIVAEPSGRIRGVISVKDSKDLLCNVLGYVVITNRHREVFLFGAGRGWEPVCHHNGFEWRDGGYIGPLEWVDRWAHYEKDKPYIDRALNGESVSFPVREDWRRWFAFDELVEALSDRRIPAIFAICDPTTLKTLGISSFLSSLRPELDNVQWGKINMNISMWANLFKLDGAHFLSKQMRIMAVCQRIGVPANYGGTEGTGRTAARFLSEKLGKSGVLIKVSSDGPSSIFYEGKIVEHWDQPF